ncbi:5-formyltetrahydrofolate cyclo-ligase [Aliifodinibius sp. S!AR15-10]|uniref:5-formyltetrahydrofolate cyclo-ligase n=1 Tax=Aliifodinibius sp. S!AR15-10 TaxID=2950437 RepID=UPI0028672439|nr:5-formyltetrahydrofolate cyclo-ligase [Aliifodinibius sp. S!AR15-10]MDR8390148.1 5-formyltetrahydrofolate cyclo-ligase [Aliifodinibius sp. S!AR15-10]
MSTKDELRSKIWQLMEEREAGAFPFPLKGRIPNFKGSHDAARKVRELEEWQRAKTVKANPDAPQLKVRELALVDGKRLFMAVPRLRDQHPFREIIPPGNTKPRKAVSIKGSQKYGKPRSMEELPEIDLIITGSVAVHRDRRRLGKGGGYSDIEFALAQEHGKITERTTIVTTVHPLQVAEEEIPFEDHDIPLDYIITPEEIIETKTGYQRPIGILPEILSDSYREEIPVLKQMLSN